MIIKCLCARNAAVTALAVNNGETADVVCPWLELRIMTTL
jgi:hypothetical protein